MRRSIPPGFAWGLALLLVLAWFARPQAYSAAAADVFRAWAFLALYVVAPGVLLCRRLGLFQQDRVLAGAMGASVGLAALGIVYVAACAVAMPELFLAYPLLATGAALAWPRPRLPELPRVPPPRLVLLLLCVATLAAQLAPLYSPLDLERAVPLDLLFHAGNAAELRNHWPMQDPRVAGTALRYHFLSSSLAASASQWTGVPVALLSLAILPGPVLVLLVLQVYNAGRVLARDALAGLLASVVVVLHFDVGPYLGLPAHAFLSHLDSGLYTSPSTCFGFVYAMSLVVALNFWFRGQRSSRMAAVLLTLAAGAASTKTSVVPVIFMGLLTLAAVRAARGRRHAAAPLSAAGLIAVAAAPGTLFIAAGAGSYSGMTRLAPLAVAQLSPFHALVRNLVAPGHELPPLGEAAVAGLWLVGFLGLGGAGALGFALLRRGRLGDSALFSLGVVAWGAVAALAFGTSSGASQLFFLYNGQLLLAIACGAFVAAILQPPLGPRHLVAAVPLAFVAHALAGHAVAGATDRVEEDMTAAFRRPAALVSSYAEGLDWLRRHAPRDAVVVTRHGAMVVSAIAERRCYYETGFFSARGHALRWSGVAEPYPERVEDRARITSGLSSEDVARMKERAGHPEELLVVLDRATSGDNPGWLELRVSPGPFGPAPPGLVEPPLFENEALRIYRALGERHVSEAAAETP